MHSDIFWSLLSEESVGSVSSSQVRKMTMISPTNKEVQIGQTLKDDEFIGMVRHLTLGITWGKRKGRKLGFRVSVELDNAELTINNQHITKICGPEVLNFYSDR